MQLYMHSTQSTCNKDDVRIKYHKDTQKLENSCAIFMNGCTETQLILFQMLIALVAEDNEQEN